MITVSMDSTARLSEVINSSVKGSNLDTLKEYLSSTPDASKAFNKETLLTLQKMLRKDGNENEMWEQMSETINRICEQAFVLCSKFINDEALIQMNVEIGMAILEISDSLTDDMLRFMLKHLLFAIMRNTFSLETNLLILWYVGTLLQKSSRHVRMETMPSVTVYLEKISNYMLVCGDYEAQVAVVEVLARCWLFIKDSEPNLFSNRTEVLKMFQMYNFVNFDPDCRLFLNEANETMDEERLVYSIPCMIVWGDKINYRKPRDPLYKEFWVDFSITSKSISFYYQQKPQDGWELMKVEEKNILFVEARNSTCKNKKNEVILAVKIKITLKNDHLKPHLPKVLQIHTFKNSVYEQMEEAVIEKVFGKKYKSEVTYTDLSQLEADSRVNYMPPQQKSLKFDESFVSESLADMNSTTHVPQEHKEVKLDTEDIVRPSPSPSVNKSGSSNVKEHIIRKNQFNIKPLRSIDSNNKDKNSFDQYIEKCIEEEHEKSIALAETPLGFEGLEVEENNENNEKSYSEKVEMLKERNKSTSMVNNIMELYTDNILNPNQASCYLGEENNSSPPSILFPSKEQTVLKKPLAKSPSNSANKQINKKSPDPHNQSNGLKKIRLYSFENNDTKDLVLSSQEDFSIEVPAYKISKQDSRIQPNKNVNRTNISKAFRTEKEIKCDYIRKHSLDVKELEQQLSDSEKPTDNKKSVGEEMNDCKSKYFFNTGKKEPFSNKVSESSKINDIFLPYSVYSDLSSSERKKRTKRTYERPKLKKGLKRVRVMQISSDSDSDYVPSGKVALKKKDGRSLRNKLNSDKFVNKLEKDRVDPIRDVKFYDEMEIDHISLEEPTIAPREIKVDVPPIEIGNVMVDKNGLTKQNCNNKKPLKASIKNNSQKTRPVKTRKPRGKKKLNNDVNITKDVTIESTKPMDIATDEHFETVVQIDNDDLALELFGQQISQDKSLLASNEKIQFGKFCLSQVNNKVLNIQNLAQKEREMNLAAFDFVSQSSLNFVNMNCQKMLAITKNLCKIKNLLDATYDLQKDMASDITLEVSKLEKAKQDLKKTTMKIEKSETNQIAATFQSFMKYIKNAVPNFIWSNSTKKPLPSNNDIS